MPADATIIDKPLITATTLKNVVVSITHDRALIIAGIINHVCPQYGINNADKLHEFLATVIHESGGFRIKTENLHYTTAERLVAVWPSRFSIETVPGKLPAHKYINNAQFLANTVYAGRMGNGDLSSNDGWTFRGRGFIQITGRDMYEKYAAYRKEDVNRVIDLMSNSDLWAMDSACWLFAVEKKLLGRQSRTCLIL